MLTVASEWLIGMAFNRRSSRPFATAHREHPVQKRGDLIDAGGPTDAHPVWLQQAPPAHRPHEIGAQERHAAQERRAELEMGQARGDGTNVDELQEGQDQDGADAEAHRGAEHHGADPPAGNGATDRG
jgi:hypothetical protein